MGIKETFFKIKGKVAEYKEKYRAAENKARAERLQELKKTREREEGRARLIQLEQKEIKRIEKARAVINPRRERQSIGAEIIRKNKPAKQKEEPIKSLWGAVEERKKEKPIKQLWGSNKPKKRLWG